MGFQYVSPMPFNSTTHAPNLIPGDLTTLRRSFALSLHSEGKSPHTRQSYLEAVDQLSAFLEANGTPTDAAVIHREHVEAFLVSLREAGRSEATVGIRYRSLQQFWRWCIEEGEIIESPMRNMRPPRVALQPVDVLTDDDIRALLATCSSRTFDNLRDAAIILLLYDTGLRRAELLGLTPPISTSTTTSRTSPGKAAGTVPHRSGIAPPKPSTCTCAAAGALTSTPGSTRCACRPTGHCVPAG
jgi:integrase